MRVELSVHAFKLRNVAGFGGGTSDPYAILTRLQEGEPPQVIGRTEVIPNALSPHWTKVFVVDYELGEPFSFVVSIFDENERNGTSKAMGSAVFGLEQVLAARGSTKAKTLKGNGTVFVSARKSTGAGTMRLKLRGAELKNVEGWLRKSDPFFELCRRIDLAGTTGWDVIYRSEDVHDDLDPVWKEATIELSFLCGGDPNLPILVRVMDHETSGKHVSMGSVETTVNMLLEAFDGKDASTPMTLSLKGKETGKLFVEFAELALPRGDALLDSALATVTYSEQPSFVEYVNGGCCIRVVVAIDYGASNGYPRNYDSLHYLDPDGSLNDYQKAMGSVAAILAKYDDDRKFPVWGFGADFDGDTSNCFQCGSEEEVIGVSGVLKAYKAVLKSYENLAMAEVTSYVESINAASQHASQMYDLAQSSGSQAYTVLLVLTDGKGIEVSETVNALKDAIDTPLSVVFVGIGEADFEQMEYLNEALSEHGRDMVSFVQFNKYRSNLRALTAATLNEIPSQLVHYFQSKGIAPSPPLHVNDDEIQVEDEDADPVDLSFDLSGDEISVSKGETSNM